MKDFCLKVINERDVIAELENVGFDKSYIWHAKDKYQYKNIKIFNLTLPQANILKQTALSVGADCAINKGVLTSEVQCSDCILGGSISQIKKIIESLKYQQFSMSELALKLENVIKNKKYSPKIVGILSLTENSFSDGGMYVEFEGAVKHLNQMILDGADLIDIGAESTKPNSVSVSAENQLMKLEPILKYIVQNNIKTPISVDTRSADVAKRVLDYGVSVINDVSGLDFDKNMTSVVAKSGAKVVIQHSQGNPMTMQINPKYKNVVDEIYIDLNKKIINAQNNGIDKEKIIVDVGIGFGKTKEHNFELIKRIEEFTSLGCEMMLGISRKSFLDMQNSPNEEKDIYTLALNTLAIERKVDYLRVHNVKLHKRLIELMKNFGEM